MESFLPPPAQEGGAAGGGGAMTGPMPASLFRIYYRSVPSFCVLLLDAPAHLGFLLKAWRSPIYGELPPGWGAGEGGGGGEGDDGAHARVRLHSASNGLSPRGGGAEVPRGG
jgi:hypothetical protein